MTDARTSRARWMRFVCAFALFCIGFAHQAPAVGRHPAAQVELSRYAFPDGSLPVLCLQGDDGGGADMAKGFGNGCAACRLNADRAVPMPVDLAGMPLALPADFATPLRAAAPVVHVLPPNAPPRAPPFASAA